MNDAILMTVVATVITCLITGLSTWLMMRSGLQREVNRHEEEKKTWQGQLAQSNSQRAQTEAERRSLETQVKALKEVEAKYLQARDRLKSAGVAVTYRQPVILLGPRGVGKTSLMLQWHAPWVVSRTSPNEQLKTSEVPVFNYEEREKASHFAMPDLPITVYTKLVLTVHDFPGELKMQQAVKELVISETEELERQTSKRLGVVLVCMFDASEAAAGVSNETMSYYNGELFRELRTLVTYSKVHVERLILVFNKYDKLKKSYRAGTPDGELLQECLDKFAPVYKLLSGVCNRERVCEVLTILDRDNMHLNNQGAPIVMGEVARNFVEAFAGKEAADTIVSRRASSYAAEKLV